MVLCRAMWAETILFVCFNVVKETLRMTLLCIAFHLRYYHWCCIHAIEQDWAYRFAFDGDWCLPIKKPWMLPCPVSVLDLKLQSFRLKFLFFILWVLLCLPCLVNTFSYPQWFRAGRWYSITAEQSKAKQELLGLCQSQGSDWRYKSRVEGWRLMDPFCLTWA